MKHLVTESAIHGVVLVAALVVVVNGYASTSLQVLVKVAATVLVFWAAHVYADVVAHLGDARSPDVSPRDGLEHTMHEALDHSWGMLLAAIPVAVLLLGTIHLLSDDQAVWAALWVAVVLLGVLGYLKTAAWATRPLWRWASAVATSVLGLALIGLKAWVH